MLRVIVTSALVAGALGCSIPVRPEQSELQRNFGAAQNAIRARQMENPQASEVLKPAEGLNAATAPDVIRNYHRNQRAENQESTQRNQRDQGIVEVDGSGGE